MYKSVSFNIFEENLQDIVYGEKTAEIGSDEEKRARKTEKTVRVVSEIVIRPLTETPDERRREKI